VTIHDAIHITHPDTLAHRVIGGILMGSSIKRAHGVLTVSDASADVLKGLFPGVEKKLETVPNALRSEFTGESFMAGQRDPSRDYLLFVGGDRPHKGYHMLLEALSGLSRKSHWKRHLVVVGERFSRSTLAYESKTLSDWRIEHRENASLDELSELYAGARLVAIPSRIEGFGLVALEALAHATPVVATPVNCLKEYFSEVAQFSTSYEAEDFLCALQRELEQSSFDEVSTMRRIKLARSFSVEKQAEKTLAIYRNLKAMSENSLNPNRGAVYSG
jgi:glycosyltransferase involved in cell wall biosynthesis